MKNLKTVSLVAALGLIVCTNALAQGRPGGPRGPRSPQAQPPTAAPQAPGPRGPAAEHLTAAYATVAPFDANTDGQLDAAEQEALAQAFADGAVQLPPHRSPPAGAHRNPEMMLHRVAGMYATVAPYDANKDGALDEAEQAALKAAIENGELPRPGGPGGPRGHRRPDAGCPQSPQS